MRRATTRKPTGSRATKRAVGAKAKKPKKKKPKKPQAQKSKPKRARKLYMTVVDENGRPTRRIELNAPEWSTAAFRVR